MLFRMKLAAVAAAGCATALTMAAGPGIASAQVTRVHRASGREIVLGEVHGREAVIIGGQRRPKIPVRLFGVVRTSGIVGIGDTKRHTVVTPVGKLIVHEVSSHEKSKLLDPRICRVETTIRGTFVVRPDRSTGVFKGATGTGGVHLRFTFNFPKRNGKCFYGSGAVPSARGALISIRVEIPRLTLR
jgi:hypothetical protein